MKPGSVVMLIIGTLFSVLGLGLLTGGAVAAAANAAQQNNGYFQTPTGTYTVDSYALTSPRERGMPTVLPVDVASIRLRAASAQAGKDIFIGIAPQADVDRYLAGVHHTELTNGAFSPFRAEYRDVAGTTVPTTPADQTWWSVSATGPGTQEIVWDLQSGSWAVVIMNADASPGVAVDMQAGVRSDVLWPVALGLLTGGGILLLIGLFLVVAGAIGLGRSGPPPARGPGQPVQPGAAQLAAPGTAPPGPATPEDRAYPARLHGELDPALSRWLWLVKWFLAIPHVIVLAFLWFAFAVTTIVAGFAILFTGRYPQALFTFNVGVLRWNWRVSFYAYSALGTDRYPPFTLAQTDYPADFEVDYPERLSHGLVLVKWWLLAIPHLLIVAAFTGAAWSWRMGSADEGFRRAGEAATTNYAHSTGPSLLGLLVLIAAVILLFTGRYRRALFDLIMGINRWIYRVIVYTALMRDEYPPFRLDQGPADVALALPAAVPAEAPPDR